jgi:hypothetical protein
MDREKTNFNGRYIMCLLLVEPHCSDLEVCC